MGGRGGWLAGVRRAGTDPKKALISRNNLASAYQAAGRLAEAIPILEQTLADSERVLGTDHPDTKGLRASLAALTGKPTLDNGE